MPDSRVYDELHELLEMPEGASYREFAERIRQLHSDEETFNRVWARYQYGKHPFDEQVLDEAGAAGEGAVALFEANWRPPEERRGDYPALDRYLDGLTFEEQATFFRTGGLQAVLPIEERQDKPWDRPPHDGDTDDYRSNLHEGTFITDDPGDLQALAEEYLEDLVREGYRGRIFHYNYGDGRQSSFPATQRTTAGPIPEPFRVHTKAQPVPFNEGRQVLWLELDVGRSERGHREIKLNDEPLRTDSAILSATVALACRRPTASKELRRLRGSVAKLPDAFEKPFSWQIRALGKAGFPPGYYRTLDLALMLLRYHKPYFDRLEKAERAELLERACWHINDFLIALRGVSAFLDYGAPGRQLRSAKGEAEKHIEAAVLKHVYGLSIMEIAREMDEPIARQHKDKNDSPTVRQWVRLGTKLLKTVLPEHQWELHAKNMKVEAERWNALTEGEQEAEEALEKYAEAIQVRPDWAREDLYLDQDPPGLSVWQTLCLEKAREAQRLLE